MFFAVAIFIVVHPGKILSGPAAKMPGVWSYLKNRKGYWGGERRRDDMIKLEIRDGSVEELVAR